MTDDAKLVVIAVDVVLELRVQVVVDLDLLVQNWRHSSLPTSPCRSDLLPATPLARCGRTEAGARASILLHRLGRGRGGRAHGCRLSTRSGYVPQNRPSI